jgi:hypothetical protein
MSMQPEIKKITEANRDAWNEVMPRHRKAAGERWDKAFMQPGFVCMRERELQFGQTAVLVRPHHSRHSDRADQ